MKRWISILMLAVFGFMPICGVLAMNPSIAMQEEPCATIGTALEMNHDASISIHSTIPKLACCEHSDASQESAPSLSIFQTQSPIVHESLFTYPIKHLHQATAKSLGAISHSPDDFERYSLAKRE